MSLVVATVELTVPDNAAFTAYETLQRMGLAELGEVKRSDVWLVEADATPQQIVAALKRTELIFNPNKHMLRTLSSDRPAAGEIWVATRGSSHRHERERRLLSAAGLAGVRSIESRVRWLLLDRRGAPLGKAVLERARELFANPAYQDALTA